jgi:cytidylate kinase
LAWIEARARRIFSEYLTEHATKSQAKRRKQRVKIFAARYLAGGARLFILEAACIMDDKVIAIDGPAGSGKSTAARRLAQALDFRYLNTGAMYRAVALIAQESGIDLGDPNKASQIRAVAQRMRFEYGEKDGQQRFIVNGQDRTDALFTVALTGQLKPVVNNPQVREALVDKMRGAAHAVIVSGIKGVVLEGRDIGTVVFPDAPIKFYIHADLDARTLRRAAELEARGETVDYDGLRRQIQYRDETDKGREVGALKQAADAIDIDTTLMDEEGTLQRLIAEVQAHHLA